MNKKFEDMIVRIQAVEQRLENKVDGLLDVTQHRVESKVDSNSIVTTLNRNANTVQECVEGALKMQLLEERAEEAEKNRRKTSVIVHGIPESEAAESEERMKDD